MFRRTRDRAYARRDDEVWECGRVLALVGATALMLWFLVGGVGVWAMFLPIALAEIGDGMKVGNKEPPSRGLHDAMVKPMPGNVNAPCLAQSWSMSEDELSWDFVLRDGVPGRAQKLSKPKPE